MTDTSTIIDKNVYLDGNDKLERFALTTPASGTGADSAATGLTGLTVHYSLTRGGAAIHADVTVALSEYADTVGLYHATIPGSGIATQLSTRAGERIWAVIKDADGHVKDSFSRYVKADRFDA